jgi:Tfp pilus assembly protein PilO
VSPIVKQQEEQIFIMSENKIKIEEFKNNIGILKASVKKLEPDYVKNSKLFHSKKEVEDLYQNISKFALINGLSITNLKKGEPKGVAGVQGQNTEQTPENTTTTENQEGQNIMYYTIPVEYEIQGNFLSYLKFRRALSKSQKVINFDKEEIMTIAEIQGQILSKGTISIVGLPNEYKE